MKTVINPAYRHVASSLSAIPAGDYAVVKTFCNNRNTVELVEIDGKPMVVKRYKKTNILTGLIYTLFRKSKARRAYEHAIELLKRDISTPFPVAYFEKSRWGIFHTGYFISEYLDLPPVSDLFYTDRLSDTEHYMMADSLSRFTLSLHLKGIVPLDYNTGNLLVAKDGDRYRFSLIDINRMRIGRVPKLKEAMTSFFQLGTYPHDYLGLLEPYVWERGFNFEDALYHVIRHRRKQRRLRKIKRLFKPKKESVTLE